MAGRVEYRNQGSSGPTMASLGAAAARLFSGGGGVVEHRDLNQEAEMRRIVEKIEATKKKTGMKYDHPASRTLFKE